MPSQRSFPSCALKIADASTISKQEDGNHAVIDCILLYGQNLLLQLVYQQLHPRPRISFELVEWLSSQTHFNSGLIPVWGVRVEKPLMWAVVFKYFRQFKEKQWPSTLVIFAPRLYNCYNHSHAPGPHMWPSPGPGPDSKCPKTVSVGCSC